jgi:hypothetical protein
MWVDFRFQALSELLASFFQVVVGLQSHPEAFTHTKVAGQSQRGIGRDCPFAKYVRKIFREQVIYGHHYRNIEEVNGSS